MNNTIKILVIALVAVLAVAAIGAGIAFAQFATPNPGYGPGWMMGGNAQNGAGYSMMGRRGGMMGGYTQNGNSWEWMDAMHDWMVSNGGMHAFVWNAVAGRLGLTSDDLSVALNNGKTLAQIAGEKGVSRADLAAALETAHKDSLAQAVFDGKLTQQQADSILSQMAGRYEWMVNNMGAGYGMMGGGRFNPGGCHGNWSGSTSSQQPTP